MAKRKRSSSGPRNAKQGETREAVQIGGRLWIWGIHAASAALANPSRRCHRLLLSEEAWANRALVAAASSTDPAPEKTERAAIAAALPAGAVHQGIAVLCDILAPTTLAQIVETVSGQERALIVVLDQANDPQNIGAVLRSAAAFGAACVILPDRHAPDITGALAKAASGALERVQLVRVANIARALEELKRAEFWIAGLDAGGGQTLPEAGLSGRIALVLGAEGGGLRRLTAEKCDYLISIPIAPEAGSLNLSAAAAIALYELAVRG